MQKALRHFSCCGILVLGLLLWFYLIWRFDSIRLFIIVIPPILIINFSKNQIIRNRAITIFVVFWLLIFFSETTRFYYRNTNVMQVIPKIKFLFPPLGWIMFWNIDDQFSCVEVFGEKDGTEQLVDPHDIFRTRTIGYDNIQRGILGTATYPDNYRRFCNFLFFRFPYFDKFTVTLVNYPEMSELPYKARRAVLYQCAR